jgi:hypothetical protein
MIQTSNFKLQTSNKIQTFKFQTFGILVFVISLVFDFWSLMFKPEGFNV